METLARLGGVASFRTLVRGRTKTEIERAVASGDIVRDARGRYALPNATAALRFANRLTGVASYRSAAAHWGWELKQVPEEPDVTLRKGRKLATPRAVGVTIHRCDLHDDDIDGLVTTKERTLVDCLRTLPFDEALTIADSALRHRDVTRSRLLLVARLARGPGSTQIRMVAGHASGKAANPFESVLRALAIQAGLAVRPQVTLLVGAQLLRPDLVDADRALILEADSFEWHGGRAALRSDARRYNAFVVGGWLVLRFAWEDVMHDQEYVLGVLRALAQERTDHCSCRRTSA